MLVTRLVIGSFADHTAKTLFHGKRRNILLDGTLWLLLNALIRKIHEVIQESELPVHE